MLVEVLLMLFLVWLLLRRWQRRRFIKLSEQLKCSYSSLPLLGHSYLFIGNGEGRMKGFQRLGRDAINRGGVISIWFANQLALIISDPGEAELVLKKCLEKDDTVKQTQILIGGGSIFAPVAIWRPRRKILAPTFSLKNLIHFMDTFNRQSSVMVNELRKVAGKGPLSMWRYATSCTMDSICETTLGVQVHAQENSDQPFLKALDILFKLVASRVCQPWLSYDYIYKRLPQYKLVIKYKHVVLDFINKVIKDKQIEMLERQGPKAKINSDSLQSGLVTFLEMLIESSSNGKKYTNLELQEETLVIVIAGTDTSAVGLAFTTMMLASHPDVQDKVYQEIEEVFGNTDRSITVDDLTQLNYLDAVMKESLRLYPPVPIIVRKADKDMEMLSGITLVEGCSIAINIWAIHRNPKYWGDNAEEFKPERFFDSPPKHPAAFMPFSNGPRGCLGYQYAMLSMKTALVSLLRQYRVLPHEDTSNPNINPVNGPLRVQFDLMMKHVDNYIVQLEPRA